MLISRERAWWVNGTNWIVVLLYVVLNEEPDAGIRASVAEILELLLRTYGVEDEGIVLFRRSDEISLSEIKSRVQIEVQAEYFALEIYELASRMETWLQASLESTGSPEPAEDGRRKRPPAGPP